MNREEVKIKFTATASGLDEIYKKIQQISKQDNIKLDDKLLGQIKDLETKIPSLMNKIQSTMSNNNFSIVDVQTLDNEFKQVSKIIDATITNLGKANLPAAIQDQIERAKNAVKKAQDELTQINNKIKNKSKKLDSSQLSGLNDVEASKVAKKEGAKFELGNQVFGTDFNRYVKAYQDLEKQGKLTTQMQEDFKINTQLLAPEFKKVADSIQLEIDAEKAKIPAAQEAIDATNRQIQSLKEQAASNKNLSDTEKKVAADIINTSTQHTKVKTVEKQAVQAATTEVKKDTVATESNTKAQTKNTSTVAKAAKQVFTYGTVLSAFRRIYSTVTSTIKDMDKALTGMAVVTNMSREQTWELVGSFQELANQTGKTTSEIASMATKFYQQGKSTSQVIQLTEAAAKAATIAGIDGSQSIDLLTNAMNGFQMSANKAMEVSDKFAALAASAATDYEELATALSKVAAQANLAGMSMDFTLGLLTKGIEVTREAPETIGTALKTVIARMRELTDYGKTLEDGVDVNRVAKALSNIGVELMDTNGQFRDLEAVLTEVGKKWDTLNKNQQANVAVALAGTRQQSRLIAMMQDFDRTMELVDISANSYGATLSQSSKYMEGMEAAGAKLKTTMEGLITAVTSSDFIIGIIDTLSGLLSIVTGILDQAWFMIPVLVLIGGHLLSSLNTKIQEKIEQREINELTLKQNIAKKQQSKLDVKARRTALENRKEEVKKLSVLDDQLEEKLKQYKLDAENSGNLALAAQYQAMLTAEKKDDLDTTAAVAAIDTEINALKAEEALLDAEIVNLQTQSASQAMVLPGLVGKVVSGATGLLSILTIIPNILRLIVGLRQKEGAQIDKNTAKEKKGLNAAVQSAGAKAAGSVAANPFWGWAVALVILAAIGVAIAASAGAFKSSGDKVEDSINQTREELNKMQADLYNLNNARQNVSKLGDEFESLSNKIVKSTEDLERMEEIATQINDTAGKNVVDKTADAQTQLKQIKAYNLQQQAQVDLKTKEINRKLGQGLSSAKIAAWWGGDSAVKKAEESYYNALKGDAAFVNSIRTVGMATLSNMDKVSATTSDTILDMLVSNIDSKAYFSESGGVDTEKFEQYVTNALQSGGYSGGYISFIQELDKVAEDGSMSAYADMLDKLGKSSDTNFNKLIDSLKQSNPMFAAVADMGTDVARRFDDIGFSSDELNTMWEKLQKTSKVLGKNVGKTFAEMAEVIDQIGDTNSDGIVSDLEARQAMYKQLVEEQKNAAESAQAIIDGTDTLSAGALKYAQNQDIVIQKTKELEEAQRRLNAENDESNPEEDQVKQLEDQINSASNALAEAQLEIESVEEAAANCKTELEELKTILGMVTAQQITEEFTKLASAMERIAKISDIASMELSEQMEILNDYPELLGALERGYLTAAESAIIYGKTITKAQDDINSNQSNYELIYSEDGGAQLSVGAMGLGDLFKDTDAGAAARQEFLNMGTFDKENALVQRLWNDPAIKEKFSTQYELIQYLQGVKADVEDYNKQEYMENQLSEGNYSIIMSAEAKELWAAATDLKQQRRNALESLNEDLEYAISTDQYIDLLKERNELLVETIQDGADMLRDLQAETKEILTVNPNDETFGWLSQYTGSDNSLSEFITYENGIAQLNYELLNGLNLTEEQRKSFESYMAMVIQQLGSVAEREKDINDQIAEDRETLAQSIIDSEVAILEAQIENLEKRKEAYEEYFDAIDTLMDEEERTATMDDLAKQISALSGGNDTATLSLRKELLAQMDDLKEEEQEARKEAAREALIGEIESQVDALNNKLDIVNESLNAIIQAIIATASDKIVVNTDEDGHVELILDGQKWTPYAEGGLVDYTGPAMVHGSPTKPEAFLSAQDTKNMQILFAALDQILGKASTVSTSVDMDSTNNVTIENVNITTKELNNDQDFKSASQIFAEEFGKAIKQRGLNINVRK